MASKKYKGKPCVYCAKAVSTTDDHVFAREFFLPEQKQNLPKVPACGNCNNHKSRLEHYLTAILPFGGRHGDAARNLEMVPRRLEKNRRLHQELAQRRGDIWIKDIDGIDRSSMTLPFDRKKFLELCSLIIKGLVWHHWKVLLSDEHHFVKCVMCSPEDYQLVDTSIFRMQAKNRVTEDYGAGTFTYTGIQGIDCPQLTFWWLDIYGGIQFGGILLRPMNLRR
jgi:hypothetical protein